MSSNSSSHDPAASTGTPAAAASTDPVAMGNDESVALWREMVRARAFDQAMVASNPHWHEARGEEGVIVGGFHGLDSKDVVAPHFRGSCAVSLMRGANAEEVAAGVFGGPNSPNAGFWRGDICPTPGPTFIGMFSGSLGMSVAYATGAALHLKTSRQQNIAVCAFGDGTANAGIVSESLNLAAMLAVPIIYICQDNGYATSLPSEVAIAGQSLIGRAKALGMAAAEVDGNDVIAVLEARRVAERHVRGGGGPYFIHAHTYRMGGHFINDPEAYRSEAEKAEWARRDPIERMTNRLLDAGVMSPAEADWRRAETGASIGAIVAAAATAPPVDRALPRTAFTADYVEASK